MFHTVLNRKYILALVLYLSSAFAQYQTASQTGQYSGQSGYYPTQTGQYGSQTTYNPYQTTSQYPTQTNAAGGYTSPQTSYQQPSSYAGVTEQSGSTENPDNRILGLLGGNRGGLLGGLLGGGGGGGGLLGNLFGLGGNRNPVAAQYPAPVPVYGGYPGSFGGYPGGFGGFGGYPSYGGFYG